MQRLWASNAPHSTPFSRGTPCKIFKMPCFWKLVIFWKPNCQTLKASLYSLTLPHFEPRFLHLTENRKILIHCLCNFNVEDDSNVVQCLSWLHKCCKHSSSWVIYVSDQERPGANQERPRPRNWRWRQVLAEGDCWSLHTREGCLPCAQPMPLY